MRPFEGIRVLDLTHVFAGPFSTYQLAVLGADVVKIEPPDNPDLTRGEGVDFEAEERRYGTHFQAQNAGKRAITLDLSTEDGKEVMRRLIETADVLVQNYAGDALEKLGFGYAAAAGINPKLIYCTLTGFGRSGPKANHPAYDVVIQAFSGLMAANGEAESPPVRVGPAMLDYGTGTHAAMAISAALYQRTLTGKGQFIDVSMLDAALVLMTSSVNDTLESGGAPEPHGNIHPTYAGYRTYPTAEGTVMVGAYTTKQLARLLDALGENARANEVRQLSRTEVRNSRDRDAKIIGRHLLTRTAADWEDYLNAHHVPAARVRRMDETLSEPQIASRPVLQSAPGGNGPTVPVAAFSYAHGSPSIDRPPPQFGEHNDEVIGALGYDADALAGLRARRII